MTLIPDAPAYADVQTVNGQGGYSAAQCDLTMVPTLRVFPPNQTESANIPWNKQECVGSTVQNLQVGPVYGNKYRRPSLSSISGTCTRSATRTA